MAEFPLPGAEPIQPLGLVGPTSLDAPNIGLKPIVPGAREMLPIDPLAQFEKFEPAFEDAGGAKLIDLNAREKLGGFKDPLSQFEKAPAPIPIPGFEKADDLDVKSVEELDANRKGFDPVAYFANSPDVAKDPAKLSKLLEIARRRYDEGLTAKGVAEAAIKQTPGLVADIAGGVKRFGERTIDVAVQPTANVVLGTLTGDLFNKQRREALFDETKKIIKKGTAEVAAGTESATVGLVDLSRTGLRKIDVVSKEDSEYLQKLAVKAGRRDPKLPISGKMTDREVLERLTDDSAFRQNAEDILKGQGESAKNIGLDKETLAKQGIEIDPEAIRLLSLVDPVTMVATGGAFKIVGTAGRVLGTARTLAGAKYITDKLADVAKFSTSKVAKGSGRVLTDIGKAAEGRTLGALGLASPLITGDLSTMATAAGVKYIAGPIARKSGAALTQLGKEIAEDVPRSVGVQRLAGIAESGTKVAVTVGEGAAKGIAAGSPFALAADSDEQAGALLGVGAALGAGGAAGAKGMSVIKDATALRYFGESRPALPEIPSPGYGTPTDAIHEVNKAKLSVQDATELAHFREALRSKGGEIYAVDQETFRKQVSDEYRRGTGKEATPEALDIYEKNHAFFDKTQDGKKVVYINADVPKGVRGGLIHDAGHIFDALLSEQTREKLRAAVKDTFTAEQLAERKANYESRLKSGKLEENAAVDEFIAENFSALFNAVPVGELAAPRGLIKTFIDVIAEGAETLGVDFKGKTPNLGDPTTVGLQNLFRKAAGEVLTGPETPPPTGPGAAETPPPPSGLEIPADWATPRTKNIPPPEPAPAPAPESRNIRVTPEQVAEFKQNATPEIRAAADARAKETGVDYARAEAKKLPEGSPTAKVIEQISDSIESGAPVTQIEHLGITSVGTPEGPIGAILRKGERAGGYAALNAAQLDVRQNAPPEIVSQHSKNFVPVRWDNQGGTPTLIAMSLDKVISNILRIASDKTVKDLIPYSVENGKLTTQGWRDVVADARKYSENQANGRMGGGGRLEVPEAGLSIPAENPAYTPQSLTPERANFQNLVQGLKTPQTSRAQKGKIPGNIKGQLLAEANLRPTEIPAKIPTKQAAKQAFVDFSPRVVKEVNSLRNEMARRGVRVQDLLEVTERIRAKDIVSAIPRPDINYKAPITDLIRGGFLPAPTEFRSKNLGGRTVEEFAKYILESSSAEWIEAVGNMTGGQTGGSISFGLGLKNIEDLAVLQKYKDAASSQSVALMDKIKAMGVANATESMFTEMQAMGTKAMFFRETLESAQGTGSMGAVFKLGRMGTSGVKVPFPIAENKLNVSEGAAVKP